GGITVDNDNPGGQTLFNGNVSLTAPQTWNVTSATGLLNVVPAIGNNGNTLTIDGAGTTALSGFAGSGGRIKNGSGTLQLSGNDTLFTGGVTLNQGTLLIGNDNALGTASLTAANGAVVQATGGPRTVSNGISVASGSLIVDGSLGNDLTLTGV